MRGLALSGGASKGSWQAGVMHRLASEGARWDVVAGVSVGAVNAAALAMFPVGDELAATRWLRDLWWSLRTKDVHRRWFLFGSWSIWKWGLRDIGPLRRYLEGRVSEQQIRTSGRKLIIGAVSRHARRWVEWREDTADILGAIMGSVAIPFAFEPQLARHPVTGLDVYFVDGGVRTVVPLESLLRLGCKEVDVIICQPEVLPPAPTPSTVFDAGLDAADTMNHQVAEDDLRYRSKGAKVNIHRPDRSLGSGMDFSPQTNQSRWTRGYEHG